MKRITALLAVTAAVFAFSCSKEQDFASSGKQDAQTLTFKADHEQNADTPDVKTYLNTDDGSVTWKSKDKVDLITMEGDVYSSEALASADDGKATVNFRFNNVEGSPVLAVYPQGLKDLESWKDTLYLPIPSVQDGSFAKAGIEVAKASGTSLAFKNVCGLLQVKINNSAVRKIIIRSNNDDPLVGTIPVSFTGSKLVLDEPYGTSNSITVNVNGAGTYYVAVLPDTKLTSGFYVELKNGSGTVVGEILTGNTLTVARRQIRKLNLENKGVIADKVFVTVNGAGSKDGSSWGNAMDKSGFFDLIKNATNETVFMAEGTYLPASEVTVSTSTDGLKVYGGYPSGLTGTSLSGRDIVNHPTILSGNGERRIFVINKNTIVATFDGLEFRNAHRPHVKNDMGSALIINASKTINVYNCVFDGNVNECTTTETETSASGGGGAVRAVSGTILFKGCTFSNNSATGVGGGAMRVGGSANVTLDACVFSNNTAAKNGGAIHMNKGTLTIKDSQFNNNNAATNGGAISITQQTTCTVTMSGTSFYHNRAASKTGYCGGAISIGPCTSSWDAGTSDVTLTNCYFEENEGHETDITTDLKNGINAENASTGGAIFVEKSATLKLNHCKFYHNLCSRNGGAIRTKDATAVLYMNACSFYMNYAGQYASTIQGTNGPIAMYNCVFYNNQNQTTTYPGTVRSSAGEILMANTSLRLASSYPGAVFSGTANSVIVNNYFVNSGAGSTPVLKKALSVAKNKTVSSFGHNLHSGYNADGSTYGTIDGAHASAGSDQEIGLDDFPVWIGTVSGIGYHLLKITQLPATYYTDPDVDFRATPAEVVSAIDYFDAQNGTEFKAWLNTLDEGNGRKPLEVDYRSYLRKTDKIWPGSYEYVATK